MKLAIRLLPVVLLGLMSMNAGATFNNFQGFDINTGDWAANQSI